MSRRSVWPGRFMKELLRPWLVGKIYISHQQPEISLIKHVSKEKGIVMFRQHYLYVFVQGLHGDSQKRKAVISDKVKGVFFCLFNGCITLLDVSLVSNLKKTFCSQMVEILLQFAECALKKCPEHGKIQVMEQHFQVILMRCEKLIFKMLGR